MLRTVLRHTLRRVLRQPGYASISIGGLALGLAASALVSLFVLEEVSFDRMHERAEDIYRIQMDVPSDAGQTRWNTTYVPVADLVRENVPKVESVARIQNMESPLVGRTDSEIHHYEDLVLRVEPDFFDVFDFRVTSGSPSSLAEPNKAFLSASAAKRYFGDEDPIGKSIVVFDKWSEDRTPYEIAGLMEDFPRNVHFRADILLSLETALQATPERAWVTLAFTYVKVRPGTSAELLRQNLRDTVDPIVESNWPRTATVVQPITRIYLHGDSKGDIAPQGDIRYVWIFSAIALLVLLIACVNYVNLATAQAGHRAREVGIRKAVGARQNQLVVQFLGESIMFSSAAVTLALGIVQAALPVFNQLMDRSLSLRFDDPMLWVTMLILSGVVGLVSGAYPAWVLSGFRASRVLKGDLQGYSASNLRRALIVFQFAVSVALIVSTIVIQRQLSFLQTTRLGFDKEHVLVVRSRTALAEASAASFREALKAVPDVAEVSASSGIPGEPTAISFFNEASLEDFQGKAPVFDHFWVSPQFAATLGLEIVEGRFFEPSRSSDMDGAFVINQATARALGWNSPVGKRIGEGREARTVIGVVRDFHYRDLRTPVGPVLLQPSDTASRYFLVRFSSADIPGLLSRVHAVWSRFIPDYPFDYSFLDSDFAAMYRAEHRLARLFLAFSILAVGLACLGLLGLTAFMVHQRTKEIGIRKVLGASVRSLLFLLSREFVALISVAFVVAGPLAWFAASKWLEGFAYRIPIGWEVFALAALASLGIAALTVSVHLFRATRSDPAVSLRYE